MSLQIVVRALNQSTRRHVIHIQARPLGLVNLIGSIYLLLLELLLFLVVLHLKFMLLLVGHRLINSATLTFVVRGPTHLHIFPACLAIF